MKYNYCLFTENIHLFIFGPTFPLGSRSLTPKKPKISIFRRGCDIGPVVQRKPLRADLGHMILPSSPRTTPGSCPDWTIGLVWPIFRVASGERAPAIEVGISLYGEVAARLQGSLGLQYCELYQVVLRPLLKGQYFNISWRVRRYC